MPKAYISATFGDLKDYRRLAAVTLKKMGYDDMAMEYYVAENRTSVERCLADVDACDLYVLIVAWRYGWVPPGSDVSITEMEYQRAVDSKKKRLVFVLDKSTPWPPDLVDDDKRTIKAFRERVQADRLAAMFSSPDGLAAALTNAVYRNEDTGAGTVDGLDVDAYFKFLRRRYGAADLDALLDPKRDELLRPKLQAIFVEQEVKQDRPPELPKEALEVLAGRDLAADDLPPGLTADELQQLQKAYVDKPSRPVLDVIAAPENRTAVILGDPGSGKSTLLRYLLLQAAEPSSNPKLEPIFGGRIPLLIDLRAYAGMRAKKDADTFLGYFDCLAKEEGCPVNASLIEHLLKKKHPMLALFDGIDEIFDRSEQETITRQIIAFAEKHPETRIVVTSRIIGYPRALLTEAGFAHFTLQDFGSEQVKSFVTQWYSLTLADSPAEISQRIERILKSFEASPSIRQLAGNPMLLTIMAIIGKHQELPRERWKLYDHAASVLVQHWDVKKHFAGVAPDFMDEEDKKDLLRELAFAMQKGKGGLRGNYIHSKELESEFKTYLQERYSLSPVEALKIARQMIDQFRTRNFILSFYGASLYGFVHRAFLEFFCASALAQRFEKTPDFGIEELRAVFREHAAQTEWHEVMRLICGIVGEQYAADLIEQVYPSGSPPRDNCPLPSHA